jgi:GNAT superfamily N-acetyltransferase
MAEMRIASVGDIEGVLPMMADFYAFERLPYDEARSRRLLWELLADPQLGRLIVFESGEDLLGYMVLGFGFSLEFGGRDVFVDEFYVGPDHRGQGIGSAALEFAVNLCRETGIRAMHLEADYFNERAHLFYQRMHFRDHTRHLMTRWLEEDH